MVGPPSSEKIQRIFDAAVNLPGDLRGAFLQGVCGEDVQLKSAVESLLVAHDAAGEFLAQPEIPANQIADSPAMRPGTRIGPYMLLKVIGEGGAGTVYLAQQDLPLRRKVALKIIKLGMDTRSVIARFDLERQALAIMDHPNIAKVLDAGSTDTGRPYFVMEWVDGKPVTRFCREHRLDLRARLELFIIVCKAVEHAHRRGVIHRDLKPSNVLVTFQDAKPWPKIIDFGIAKSLSSEGELDAGAVLTHHTQFLGTPQYMSPEQAELPQRHVDSRSDVYSLGALLYELIADVPPFDPVRLRSAAYTEIHRILLEERPPEPSSRLLASTTRDYARPVGTDVDMQRRAVAARGDLDWVVMKALEKDPRDRYESAGALAEDISRVLAQQPVAAGPTVWHYRTRMFVRRNRRSLLALGALLIAIVLGELAGIGVVARTLSTDVASYDVSAYFDTEDWLLIRGNTLQWHHPSKTGAAVGRHRGSNAPTTLSSWINGKPMMAELSWTPDWPSPPPAEIRLDAHSSTFEQLNPAMPAREARVVTSVLSGRGTVAVGQLPAAENGYQLIVRINDHGLGAATTRVLITVNTLDPVKFGASVAGFLSVGIALIGLLALWLRRQDLLS